MGRPKFQIGNEKDSSIFLNYLADKEGVLYTEVSFHKSYEDENQKDYATRKFTDLYKKITDSLYRINTAQETQFIEQTELLYMLPYNRIEKIKTSIRAKRKSKYEKKKRQLTVDDHVHLGLSMYAKRYNITLSDAIEKLLRNCQGEPY